MRFVSPALKHIVFPVLSRSGYLRRSIGDGPAIVTYHGVFPSGYRVLHPALDGNLVHAESLRQQLQLLKKHYQVISPDNFLGWIEGESSLPPRSVLLTCDDGLQNNLTEMVPILRDLGLSCLFFILGASVEQKPSMLWYDELYLMLLDATIPIVLNVPEAEIEVTISVSNEKHACWWKLVEQLSKFGRQTRRQFIEQIQWQLKVPENWQDQFFQDATLSSRFFTLDLSGVLQLVAAGMTVGAHSLTHPILAKASEELSWNEIRESRGALENALGKEIWAFGYPFGNPATVTRRECRFAEQAGFRSGFLNVGGGFGAEFDCFTIPRVHVTSEMSLAEFEAHVTGFYRSLREGIILSRRSELTSESLCN